jgi:hypothetical protein
VSAGTNSWATVAGNGPFKEKYIGQVVAHTDYFHASLYSFLSAGMYSPFYILTKH